VRILQEALSNVRRHADATVIRVQVVAVADRITLSVRDDGRASTQRG
jgi:Signal transduction histidine kinase